MKTCYINTLKYLETEFLTPAGTVNAEWFTQYFTMILSNNYGRRFFDDLLNTRRPVYAVVWEYLVKSIDAELKSAGYGTACTGDHIKKFFAAHGTDYKTGVAGLVEYYTQERAERIAEAAGND